MARKRPSKRERERATIDAMSITRTRHGAAGWLPADVDEAAALDLIEARAGLVADPIQAGDAHLEFAEALTRSQAAVAARGRARALPAAMMEHIARLAEETRGADLMDAIIDHIRTHRTPELRSLDLSKSGRVVALLKRSSPALPDAVLADLEAVKRSPGRPKKL